MSSQRVGALVYGLGADESACTPLATPLISLMADHESLLLLALIKRYMLIILTIIL